MDIKKRIVKRFRRIANDRGITYAEVLKVFRSQFKFTKETIEKLETEDLSKMSAEELDNYVFNFMYLGKIYTNKQLQKTGNKKNNIGEEDEEN